MKRLAWLFTYAACCVLAQNGQISGLAKDGAGSSAPDVQVKAVNTKTGLTREVLTNEQGFYSIPSLPPGDYDVTASKAGFESVRSTDLKLDTAQQARFDFILNPATVATSIDVLAAAPVLNSNDATVRTTIAHAVAANLPLNGRRYSDLALLVPGVRKSSLMRSGSFSDREGSFNVNGQPSAFNNFMLDGIDNNAYGTSNRGYSNQVIQPSPDAIEEFTVQTNTMSAEYGRAVGANISATIRGGTNDLHGSLYEYLRNTAFNATGFFKPQFGGKPTLNRNQFGVTIGGPIRKDRTFFFADYEGIRETRRSLSFYTAPTVEMRQGNIGVAVQNPLTGEVYTDGRIPRSAMQAFTTYAASQWPEPNRPGLSNNWETLLYSNDKLNKGDAKIDHRFSDRLQGMLRYSSSKRDIYSPIYPSEAADPGEGRNYILLYQGTGSLTRILSPSTVAEFRMSYSLTKAGKTPLALGSAGLAEQFGIHGLPDTKEVVGGINTQSVSGWSGLGRQSTNPQYQNPEVWNLRPTITRLFGRHSLKAGYEYQRINTEVQDVAPLYGIDTYSGQFSKPAGGTGTTAMYNLADFLMGLRSSYELTNYSVVQVQQRMHYAYLQDDFRVSNKLTLNLGLRYEFATPQFEANNHLANFNLQTLQMEIASDGSLEDRTLITPDRNNFAPRLGLGYQITPKTVLRAGYGFSYVHYIRRGATMTVYNPPFYLRSSLTQRPQDPGFRTTEQGYPAGFTAADQFDPLRTSVRAFDRSGKTPYVQNWTLSLQQQFGRSWVLELAYIGNHGIAFPSGGDINQPRPNRLGEDLPTQDRRPRQGFSSINVQLPIGASSYNGLQAKLERRFANGLMVMNSFTWSKTMDNYCAPMEDGNNCGLQNWTQDLASEWAVSTLHQAVNNVTSVVYELPFGRGRRFGRNAHPLVNAVAGGWRLTAVNTAETGEPVNLTWSPAARMNVGVPVPRPDVIGDVLTPSDARGPGNYLNSATVLLPADYTNPYGSAGRNIGRSPAQFNCDLGAHKRFPILTDRLGAEFRAEAFNILNHTNFRAPNANLSNANFGTITAAYPARILQLALRIEW